MNRRGFAPDRVWSTTRFADPALRRYAESHLAPETRDGLKTLCVLLAGNAAVVMMLQPRVGLAATSLYAYGLVAALGALGFVLASRLHRVRDLHRVAMALFVLTAAALALVAHGGGRHAPLLLANVVLLFVVIPLIPWGLREAGLVAAAIGFLVSSFTLGALERFGGDTLGLLHVLMFATASASLAVVTRATVVRRAELEARHELEQARARLFRLANVDPLTGAWNRRYFEHAFAELCNRYGDEARDFHFVLFDIDDFKELNDTFGHAAGDRVLVCVAEALTEHLGERGYVIRLGGDEFCALFVSNEAQRLLRRAVDDIRRRVLAIDGLARAKVSLSFGRIEASLEASMPMPVLYRRADRNMYEAKQRRGRGRRPYLQDVTNFEDSGSWLVLGA